MRYRFDLLTSTNDEARDPKYGHGDIIWAEEQLAGRGQRGHTWISPKGENLTFSLVVEPKFLPANEQFRLLETIALALCDAFKAFGIETRIKWTNDIYHADRKLVGILIEHFYSGATLRRTVVGIGINVNQANFDPSLPNPTSMHTITGKVFEREQVLERVEKAFAHRFAQLQQGDYATLARDYHTHLYRLGCEQLFRLPDGTEFTALIEGVASDGALVLRHADQTRHQYQFKEVEFVIKK